MIDSLRRNPLLLALALLVGVLAVVLSLELRLAAPAARDVAAKGARPVEAKLMPPIAARPPEQAYPEVTARPLFVSTRRPAPEAAVAQAPSMPRGKFVLQGVIVQGDQRTALLRERTTGRVHRANAGQEVDGLKVLQIERESVTLGVGDERETVSLIVQKGGAPAMAGVAGVVPGAPGAGPFAVANPFPRPGIPGAPGGSAQGAPGQVTQVPPPPATPLPTAPGFGPPLATPGSPATAPNPATTPTAPGTPQAGPAFPMSPEELLARRRARRAQQNQ